MGDLAGGHEGCYLVPRLDDALVIFPDVPPGCLFMELVGFFFFCGVLVRCLVVPDLFAQSLLVGRLVCLAINLKRVSYGHRSSPRVNVPQREGLEGKVVQCCPGVLPFVDDWKVVV